MKAIKYKNGKMMASIMQGSAGYLLSIYYNHCWAYVKWYTRLSSAKRGLERVLTDLAISAEEINYKRVMEEAGCE